MPTIADNVRSMAALVANVKKEFHLTENTVLRIVDMNFALAHNNAIPTPFADDYDPNDDDLEAAAQAMGATLFPINPDDIAEVEEPDTDVSISEGTAYEGEPEPLPTPMRKDN